MDKSADDVKRVMIVNLWRPLHGEYKGLVLGRSIADSQVQ